MPTPPSPRHESRLQPQEEVPTLQGKAIGILFCICPDCYQVAIYRLGGYEALCPRCEQSACTDTVSHH